jgi:hypothetical protein
MIRSLERQLRAMSSKLSSLTWSNVIRKTLVVIGGLIMGYFLVLGTVSIFVLGLILARIWLAYLTGLF